MRKFGKLLVFTNLILSLLFLSWSVGLYMQRMDWAPRKSLFGEVNPESGRLYELSKEIGILVEHRDLAEVRWQTDSTTLPRLFELRNTYKDWYADQLALALTGKNTKSQPDAQNWPVRRNVQDKGGLLSMNPRDRDAYRDSRAKPVLSIAEYQQQQQKLRSDLEELHKEIAKLIQDNEKLTTEIAGVPGKSKGLRGKLEDRHSYKKLWEDEIAYLKPHLVNQLVNVEQQKRRYQELEARLKQLVAAQR